MGCAENSGPWDAPASEANCVAVLGNLLVLSALVVCLKRGEENRSEKELKDEEPRKRFVGNAVQVAELHPNRVG